MSDDEKTPWERDTERVQEAIEEAVEGLDLEASNVNYVSGKRFEQETIITTRLQRSEE